jgi:hypothetical protein
MNKLEARFDRITRTIITDIEVRRTAKPGSFVSGAPVVDIPTRALWDTGAYMSVISASLAQQLGLAVINTDKLTGIGGTILSNRYDISVTLPNKVIFPLVYVAEWGGNRFYDMLIGMDIISQGEFFLSSVSGKTVFTFKA